MREGSLRQYLSGSVPGIDKAAAIAAGANVTLDWLIAGRGPMRPGESASGAGLGEAARGPFETPAPLPDFVMVPRYDLVVSAGPGAFADAENVKDYMAFREDFVRRHLHADPRDLALITAIGDSMTPTISPGDLLLVDRGVGKIMDDAIYVLLRRGELVVKRVQAFFNGAVTIRSDNAAYVEETFGAGEADQLHVAGRVRWIGRLI